MRKTSFRSVTKSSYKMIAHALNLNLLLQECELLHLAEVADKRAKPLNYAPPNCSGLEGTE